MTDKDLASTPPNSPRVNRREFIALGSAAVAGLASSDLLAATRAATGNRAISIGYWGGLPAVAGRRSGARASFENAFALTESDPAFHRAGARVSVRGLWRPESSRNGERWVAVNQLFRDGSAVHPFFAWTLSTRRGVSRVASPVTFTVPVEVGESIDIEILHGTSEAAASRSILSLSPLAAAGKVMLNAGTYIVALGDGPAAPVPDWSAVRLASRISPAKFSGAEGLILVNGAEPSFEYLVFTVGFPAEANVAAEEQPVLDEAIDEVPAAE